MYCMVQLSYACLQDTCGWICREIPCNTIHVPADQCATVATANAKMTKLWHGPLMHGKMGMSRHAYALLSGKGQLGPVWGARQGRLGCMGSRPAIKFATQVYSAVPSVRHPGWSLMRHLACSSGAQFEDLPPSAVEESPGTPARLRSLRPLINSSGLVRYGLLIEDPSLLLHNVAVVQDYAELDWGSKENSARNIAFYCNAYNIWSMYLAFKKMRKHGLAWKGIRRHIG
jgi:hypothetical protein